MSLHLAAKHLASKGRDEDTELVHMTKGEVKGLQALAMAGGGSLSINPDTGLVEAGFLKNMLPTLVGAGLMMVPGMQGVGAGMIGGGVGLLEYARTGDIGKGLMAGLGAYGGAGLAGGLMGAAGAAGAGGASGLGGTGAGLTAAENLGAGTVGTAPGVSSTVSNMAAVSNSAAPAATTTAAPSFMGNLSQAGQGLSNVTGSGDAAMKFAGQNMKPLMAAATPMVAGSMEQPQTPGEEEYVHPYGIKRLSSDFTGYVPARPNPYYRPTGLGYAKGGEVEHYAEGGLRFGLGRMRHDAQQNMQNQQQGGSTGFNPIAAGGFLARKLGIKAIEPTVADRFANFQPAVGRLDFGGAGAAAPYIPRGLGYEGYAEGGDIMLAAGGSYDDEPRGDNQGYGFAAGGMTMGQGIYKDTDEDTASLGAYDAARKRVEKQFGAANLKAKPMPKSGIARLGEIKTMASGGLGGYSDGGHMLKGPGDGMSDSIPAVIGKKQPARLADGEFVVPADVVSHLGNGSTDAGARKLYGMMDKIRTARTGKKKQAPAVKADKYMPA